MENYFRTHLGTNSELAIMYLFTKVLVVLVPVFQWFSLCMFYGDSFEFYGWNLVTAKFVDTWPSPADIVFPRVAKCEIAYFGVAGDLEIDALICHIPENNILRWTMFFVWMWMLLMFVISIIHPLFFFFFFLRNRESFKFGDFVILTFMNMNQSKSTPSNGNVNTDIPLV